MAQKKSARKVPQKRFGSPEHSMAITTPILEHYLAQSKVSRFDRWSTALAVLNQAVVEQSIYNVDMQDVVKYQLGNGIEQALEVLLDAFRPNYHKLNSRVPTEREVVWNDVHCYCQFNQAKGRIQRLQKCPALLQDFPILNTYIAALQEVVAINDAIVFLKPFIIKGRKPLENPKPIDLSNTGTCPICQNRQKLTGSKHMVHHGFHISDGYGHYFGFRSGRCFGCSYQPYELSNAGNIAYKKALEEALGRTEQSLADHKAGKVTTLSEKRFVKENGRHIEKLVVVKQGEPDFPRMLATEIHKIEWAIDSFKRDITFQEHMIKNWTLKPLPGDVPVQQEVTA